MKFSKYNRLFHSPTFGRYLYNALSNTLIELDAAHYEAVAHVRDTGEIPANLSDHEFWSVLREQHMLVESGQDDRTLDARRQEREALCSDGSRLSLAVCPTLQCNFACRYCFEPGGAAGAVLSPDTMTHILRFIGEKKTAKRLHLTWYGGEPTLAFHVVRELTARVQKLDCELDGAAMITNGYLLDSEKIALLGELKIQSIQITLDGPQPLHDRRRTLLGGQPTFRRILDNLRRLFDSAYEGEVAIRMNVDKENLDGVVELRESLRQEFRGKRLIPYPALVEGCGARDRCGGDLDPRTWPDHLLGFRRRSGMVPPGGFYPPGNLHCVCTANNEHGVVIGPSGELYKCWMDVGRPERVVGNVSLPEPIVNRELCDRYRLEADPYRDPICRNCATLPLCGGGCAANRLRVIRQGEDRSELCSSFRDHLVPYLEVYLDALQTQDLCTALLTPGPTSRNACGYRLVSPQPKG